MPLGPRRRSPGAAPRIPSSGGRAFRGRQARGLSAHGGLLTNATKFTFLLGFRPLHFGTPGLSAGGLLTNATIFTFLLGFRPLHFDTQVKISNK